MSLHCPCPSYDKGVFKDKGAHGGQKCATCDKGMQVCPDATTLGPPPKPPPGEPELYYLLPLKYARGEVLDAGWFQLF